MRWLVYLVGWAAVFLTLPTALTIAVFWGMSKESSPEMAQMRAQIYSALQFSPLPLVIPRIAYWVKNRAFQLPLSFSGWRFSLVAFSTAVSMVILCLFLPGGQFSLLFGAMPIVSICAGLVMIGMLATEITDWVHRIKRPNAT